LPGWAEPNDLEQLRLSHLEIPHQIVGNGALGTS
jgi:hypothetical protein